MTTHLSDSSGLPEALEALHAGLSHAPVAVGFLQGPDHVVRFANRTLLDAFGDRPLVGRPLREAAPEAAAEGWLQVLDRIYATGEGVTAAAAAATLIRDGRPTVTYHNVTAQPVRDEAGSVTGVCVAGVEVTDQVRARAEAAQDEQRFRTFVDTLEAVIWEGEADPARPGGVRLDYVSGHAERMFGHPVEAWLRERDLRGRLLHPEDRDRTLAVLAEAAASGRDHEAEYRALTAEGRLRWVREIVHARAGEPGRAPRFSGVIVDITERKRAEAIAQGVIDAAPDGFALFDTDLRYVHVNEALARINGVPAAEHVGRTPGEVLSGIPAAGHVEPLRRVLATGRPVVDLEVQGVAGGSEDEQRTWLVSYFPIREASGRIVRLGAFVTDITERKRAEERSELVAELGVALEEVMGLEDRARRLERALAGRLAETCTVELTPPRERVRRSVAGGSLTMPMRTSGRTVGRLVLTRSGRWSRADVALVEELAQRAATALEAARLYESERGARERIARLQAVTAALSEALTPADVAVAIIDEGMASLGASMAAVWQVDAEAGELELIGHRGWAGREQRVPMRRIELTAPLPVPDAVRSRRSIWLPDGEAKAAAYPALAGRAGGVSGESLLVLPLTARTGPVGAVALCFSDPARLDAETRAFAAALAAQCSQALERARLYESERQVATILQRSLLPLRMPEHRALECAVRYLPAAGLEAGGDFYEAIELPSGALGLAVGDVVGHGADAAATMGQLRSALRAFALQGDPPATVLSRLSAYARTVDGALAATAAYCIVDPAARTLRYACAGHPFPLLARPHDGAELLSEGRSVPLGLGSDIGYVDAETPLEPGATLLLYTDGLVENRIRSFDEAVRLVRDTLASLVDAPLAEVLDELVARQGVGSPVDDVALLAVRLLPARAEVKRVRIPARPTALAQARAAIRGWLGELGAPEDLRTDVLLASGEALANAVEHAYRDGREGEVDMELRAGGDALELAVQDSGRWRTETGGPDRGRGLVLMRAVMDEVVVERAPQGTRVVLRTRLRSGPASPAEPTEEASLERPTVAPRGELTIKLSGDVDAGCAAAIGTQMRRLMAGERLVADLSDVTYLDSSGLRMLLDVARAPGRLAIVAPPATPARRALEVAGVYGVLEIVDR